MISTIIFFLVALTAWILPVTLKVKRSVHMLQLNSYRNERYAKWMSENSSKVYSPAEMLYLVPLIVLLFSNSDIFILAVTSAVFVLVFAAFYAARKPEKKKLVYTQRVQRLFGVTYLMYGLIAAVATGLGAFVNIGFAVAILLVTAVFPFSLVKLTNLINEPIERSINQRFVDDAKRLIQSSPDLKVVGITGSYGKTSVKHFVEAILSSKYNVLMTPESYNTRLGVTRTINEQLKPYHEIFIAEMGAKQTGDIQDVCEIVNQQYGILTAIGPQHLDTFKTLDNIKKTKHEIVETLPEGGVAVLNKDDENIMSYEAKNPARRVYYGVERTDVDIHAGDIGYSSKGMTFTVTLKDGTTEHFRTRLLGKHNIYNVLAAIAIGLEMGMTLQQMAVPVKNLPPVKHRLELKPANGNITIIDDSFNSNPVGSKMAVEVLGKMDGFRMLVTPGMIELGDQEYELNKTLALHAAENCDYVILVGKKQTKPLQDGLAEANYPESQFYVAADLNDAIQHMHEKAQADTIVLLENDLPDTFNE
ncbi:UDP-N-acetylmuramoyl-tripeptide--D-alanyl-D-alanine ligase [Alkalicoccus luteus]|uniref:UDP-N-acetylmuramoyl-tripeptide--D-alanyl-D-alanine ligase n=1 Tax=Alkalicoccus luteus TaxID=1237094 RepID=A0A969PSL4_9BACI|nr:UDP-N-acetylmuramoyl-tripeptide--D-alanyl-D-alanine ligase [Alkalicoccus luteus]NJP38608.1 UDP-N-acetylmuramoyl-tripeptide--D-alanyl-D-alanine ligase [Alkalicoccus luteus]